MTGPSRQLVVVGQGGAGLCAALAAAETARQSKLPLQVTILEKAPESEAGGNTRWTPANMRMGSPGRVEPGFVGVSVQSIDARPAREPDRRARGGDGGGAPASRSAK